MDRQTPRARVARTGQRGMWFACVRGMATRKKRGSKRKTTSKKKRASKRRYSKAASKKVGKVMHEAKRGRLRSGRSAKKVTSRKQAVAIALSEARRSGAKVPPRRKKR
jgi:hypothetical protein